MKTGGWRTCSNGALAAPPRLLLLLLRSQKTTKTQRAKRELQVFFDTQYTFERRRD